MKKILKNRIIPVILSVVLALGVISPAPVSAAGSSDLGKLWDSFSANSSTYTLNKDSRIFVIGDAEPSGDLLQTVQLAQRQLAADAALSIDVLDIVWGAESHVRAGDVVVKLDATGNIASEGYQLEVTDSAKIIASDVDGLLYGLNNFQKYLRCAGTTISGFTAADVPDTVERTVQLDCARKYFTKDWICNFIREMSWMGYNTLSLHFSEDGGFRMDIWDPAYYGGQFNPVNDFSWICGSHVQYWVHDGYDVDPDAGKYLTASELIEILNVAKEYHIDVIPSFDSPSHMDYLTWKFEQNYKSNSSYAFTYDGTTYKASSNNGCINYTGTRGGSAPNWYYAAVDVTEDTMARAFVLALYEDIADFFKEYAGSTEFSIGADEVGQGSSVIWGYSDFVDYINDLNELLNSKGYTMRMFNDFIDGDYLDEFTDNIEILYWNSPFSPYSGGNNETDILTVADMVSDGRTLYNCIQTNTYYVLRVATSGSATADARNPENRNWTFYHSDEDSIYDEWYPADLSEHGDYSEDVADVPAALLGGGYFLLWNDYASASTEAQVWYGVDSTGKWNVIDRMWSNTIKMWNCDIDDSVSYSQYAALRDTLGDYPGFTSCSDVPSMPQATAPAEAPWADHSALKAALAEAPADPTLYTEESWAKYKSVYEAAAALDNDLKATADAIAVQINALTEAQAELVRKGYTVTVQYVNITDGASLRETENVMLSYGQLYYEIPIKAIDGYRVANTDGTVFADSADGDGSGTISGAVNSDITVMLIYESHVDKTELEAALSGGYTEQGSFTDETWNSYQEALEYAKKVADREDADQNEIDEAVNALKAAQDALVIESSESTGIISVEKIGRYTVAGKKQGLVVTTTTDVQTLVVSGQKLTMSLCNEQELNGETVKVWMISFIVGAPGTVEYTVVANGSITETVECVIK